MRTNAKIYVMRKPGIRGVKIGHARDPGRRALEIGRDISVEFTTPVVSRAEVAERAAHRILFNAGKRISGEWFDIAVDEAIAAIERGLAIANGDEPLPPVVVSPVVPIRMDRVHLEIVDELRRVEKDIPTRSEMIRRLIERAGEKKRK